MDELAARRAGRREANLRALNERIAAAQAADEPGADQLRIVCECARADCEATIDVPSEVFNALCEDDDRYLIVPGHELHSIERVVDTAADWAIVEKVGAAAGAAREQQA